MKRILLFGISILIVSKLFSQDTIRVYIFDDKSKKLSIYRERLPKKVTVDYRTVKNYWGQIHHLEFDFIKFPRQGDQIYFWITDRSFPYIFKTWYFIDLGYESGKVIFISHDSQRKNRYRFVARWFDKDFKFID